MLDAIHTLALQNVPQQKGGGLGVSVEVLGATLLACALLTVTVLLLSRYKQRRDQLVLRERQARLTAGDPGPVLARRLSNSEYDYTIRDLTGVDIRPTRAFPVDPANQAGTRHTCPLSKSLDYACPGGDRCSTGRSSMPERM